MSIPLTKIICQCQVAKELKLSAASYQVPTVMPCLLYLQCYFQQGSTFTRSEQKVLTPSHHFSLNNCTPYYEVVQDIMLIIPPLSILSYLQNSQAWPQNMPADLTACQARPLIWMWLQGRAGNSFPVLAWHFKPPSVFNMMLDEL